MGAFFLPTIFALFITLQVRAETVMSWDDCMSKTVGSSADLAAAVDGVRVARAQFTGSYYNFLPQLSAAAGYVTSGSQGVVPTAGALTQTVTIQNQYSESLSANQSLFNGFTDVGKVRQARANIRAAVAALNAEKATLSAALKTAFAQLLYQQKSVELTNAIWDRQKVNLRMIDLRFRGGSENKGSLLYQEGTVAQAKYQHEHAVRQLRNAEKQLGALWGEPDIKDVRVTGELAWHEPTQEKTYAEITSLNPSHVNFDELRLAADAYVEVEDGAWYPNLNLAGSVGRVGPSWPPQESRWSVGVTLSFPFFPGTSNISNSQTARAQRTLAEHQEQSTDYKLVAGLENAYQSFLDAIGQVEVAKAFLTGAQARSKIANGRYGAGLMTFEDWTVIDTDLVNREQNLLQAQLNAVLAEATWESAQGVGEIK